VRSLAPGEDDGALEPVVVGRRYGTGKRGAAGRWTVNVRPWAVAARQPLLQAVRRRACGRCRSSSRARRAVAIAAASARGQPEETVAVTRSEGRAWRRRPISTASAVAVAKDLLGAEVRPDAERQLPRVSRRQAAADVSRSARRRRGRTRARTPRRTPARERSRIFFCRVAEDVVGMGVYDDRGDVVAASSRCIDGGEGRGTRRTGCLRGHAALPVGRGRAHPALTVVGAVVHRTCAPVAAVGDEPSIVRLAVLGENSSRRGRPLATRRSARSQSTRPGRCEDVAGSQARRARAESDLGVAVAEGGSAHTEQIRSTNSLPSTSQMRAPSPRAQMGVVLGQPGHVPNARTCRGDHLLRRTLP